MALPKVKAAKKKTPPAKAAPAKSAPAKSAPVKPAPTKPAKAAPVEEETELRDAEPSPADIALPPEAPVEESEEGWDGPPAASADKVKSEMENAEESGAGVTHVAGDLEEIEDAPLHPAPAEAPKAAEPVKPAPEPAKSPVMPAPKSGSGKPLTAEVGVEVTGSMLVTRHYDNKEGPSKSEPLKVGCFVGPVAKVGVGYSMTINLGDFQSTKVSVTVEVPTYVEELAEAYAFAEKFASERLAKEVHDITNGGSDTDTAAEETASMPSTAAAPAPAGDPDIEDMPLEEVG